MSGSDGSSEVGSGMQGGAAPIVNCTTLSIRTHITSPNSAIVMSLRVGQYLQITLQTTTGPIMAVTDQGDIVGSVFTPQLANLINCIAQGHQYQARITSLEGAECEIHITHI